MILFYVVCLPWEEVRDETDLSNTIFYLLVFLLIIGVVSFFNNNNEPTKTIDYSTFINKLEDNQVKSFSVQPSRGVYELKGQMRDSRKMSTSSRISCLPMAS